MTSAHGPLALVFKATCVGRYILTQISPYFRDIYLSLGLSRLRVSSAPNTLLQLTVQLEANSNDT